MPGLIVNGREVPVPGVVVQNFHDYPRLHLAEKDRRPRRDPWIRQIVLHTTKGIPGGHDQRPQDIRDGWGPHVDAAGRCLRAWAENPEPVGAHIVIDSDGLVSCLCDLATDAAQHGRHANQTSIGIEIYQGADAELYREVITQVLVPVVDVLTGIEKIQRQIPEGPFVGPSQRLMADLRDVVGVLGHRDFDRSRGSGDPGSFVFTTLGAAGYEPMNFDLGEDREIWRRRQRDLGIKADGIPGPGTVAAIMSSSSVPGIGAARPAGLWVQRPSDTA